MPKLTVIILNHNTKELTLRAIKSCHHLPHKDVGVIVVDNESTDGSAQEFRDIEKREQGIKIIELEKNIGFAGGNNVALRRVKSDYVMLLNSDAYFPPNEKIEKALAYLDTHPDIGILSPYVELGMGSIDPACHRGFPSPWNAFTYFSGLEKSGIFKRMLGGYHQTWADLNSIHEIDACTGAAMIVRNKAIDEVGLLDEQFFMYGEDLDWCYRFKQKGWFIVYYPFLKVIHDKHSSGLKKKQTKSTDAFYEAMKLFYKKHDLGPAWMENLVLLGIHLLSKIKLYLRHKYWR